VESANLDERIEVRSQYKASGKGSYPCKGEVYSGDLQKDTIHECGY